MSAEHGHRVAPGRCPTCGHRWNSWTAQAIIAAARRWNAEHGRYPASNDWRRSSPDHPGHRTVRILFGSWNGMIAAAGGVPRSSGGSVRRWDEQAVIDAMLDHLLVNGRWPKFRDWRHASAGRPTTDTVLRVFGTWNKAKYAAGWDPCAASRPAARVARAERGCAGCGAEFGNQTFGCNACSNRLRRRERRAAEKCGPVLLPAGVAWPSGGEPAEDGDTTSAQSTQERAAA